MKFQEFKNGNIRYTDPDNWYYEFAANAKSVTFPCLMCNHEVKSVIYVRDSNYRSHIEIPCCQRCYFIISFIYSIQFVITDPKVVTDTYHGI